MAYISDALHLIESYLAASGRFSGGVMIGQPAAPPETPAAAVFMSRGSASLLTIGNWQRQRDVTVRVYMDVTEEPRDDAELRLDEIVFDVETDIQSDLNLSATGWIILGSLTEEFDYTDVGGRLFRTADIVLPLAAQT